MSYLVSFILLLVIILMTVLQICDHVYRVRNINETKYDIMLRLFLLYQNDIDEDYDYVTTHELLYAMNSSDDNVVHLKLEEGPYIVHVYKLRDHVEKFYTKDNKVVKISKDPHIFLLRFKRLRSTVCKIDRYETCTQ